MSQIIEGYSQYPLAVGKVRYAGEPVAFVVADDRYIAEDGADLVHVEYEPLPVVADRDAALRGDVLVDEAKDSNVAYHEIFEFGDLDQAFAEADHVVERQIVWRRSCGVPLDTNGAIAIHEGDGAYTIHANTQIPRVFNAIIAVSLRTTSNKLRIVRRSDVPRMIEPTHKCGAIVATERLLSIDGKFLEQQRRGFMVA